MNQKYTWDRNIPHHRVALTRFSVFAFIQSLFAGMLTILGMGIASDGTRYYVTMTAILGLLTMLVTFGFFFMMMAIMYNWVIDEREKKWEPKAEKKPTADVFYQTATGWEKGKKGVIDKQGGGVDSSHRRGYN